MSSSTGSDPPVRTRRLIAVVTGSAVSGTLPVFLIGALAVQLRADLHYGVSEHGVLVSLFFFTVAVAALPLGPLVDRIGWRRSVRLSVVALGLVMVTVAAAGRGWWWLVGLLVIAGAAHALGMPSGNVAIVQEVRAPRRGAAFGVRQAAIPLATLLGGLSVPVVAVHFGWRPVLALAAVVPLLVVLALRGLPPPPPDGGTSGMPDPPKRRSRPPLTWPLAVMLALGAIGAVLVNTSSAFLVITAVESGVTEAAAGVLLVAGSGVAFAVRILAGMLADRAPSWAYTAIAGLLAVGVVGFVLIAVGGPVTIVVGTVLAFGAGTGWPGLMHYVITAEHPQHAGGVSGLILSVGNAGGFLGPVAFGLLAEQFSYRVAWAALAAAAVVAIVCVTAGGRGFAARRARAGVALA